MTSPAEPCTRRPGRRHCREDERVPLPQNEAVGGHFLPKLSTPTPLEMRGSSRRGAKPTLPGQLAASVSPLSPDGRRYASDPAFGLSTRPERERGTPFTARAPDACLRSAPAAVLVVLIELTVGTCASRCVVADSWSLVTSRAVLDCPCGAAVLLAIPVAAVLVTRLDVLILKKDPAQQDVPSVIFPAADSQEA